MKKKRAVSFLLIFCMILSLFGGLTIPARAYAVSDWVPESEVPDGSIIVDRQWMYNRTTYLDSWDKEPPEEQGYKFELEREEYIQVDSDSKFYAPYFPDGFDETNELYSQFHSDGKPYRAYEDESKGIRREVTDERVAYIYWHWMYEVNGASGTPYRMIYFKKGIAPQTKQSYTNFGAFVSEEGDYYSDTSYCNSANALNYVIPERTAYEECQGATRWFRIDINRCSYTDYQIYYHYKYVEEDATSATAVNEMTKTYSDDDGNDWRIMIDKVRPQVKYVTDPSRTLRFDPNYPNNGQTGKPAFYEDRTVFVGGTYGDLPTPNILFYQFAGWWTKPGYSEEEGILKHDGESAAEGTIVPEPEANEQNQITLYAHWKKFAGAYVVSEQVQGKPGDECSVVIALPTDSTLASAQFSFEYNPNLIGNVSVETETGEILYRPNEMNTYYWHLISGKNLDANKAHDLVRVNFVINKDVTPGYYGGVEEENNESNYFLRLNKSYKNYGTRQNASEEVEIASDFGQLWVRREIKLEFDANAYNEDGTRDESVTVSPYSTVTMLSGDTLGDTEVGGAKVTDLPKAYNLEGIDESGNYIYGTERFGYAFDGWYITQAQAQDSAGKTSDVEKKFTLDTLVNAGTSDTVTVKAHWIKLDTATIRIVDVEELKDTNQTTSTKRAYMPGDQFEARLSISNDAQVSGLGFSLRFDDKVLELVSATGLDIGQGQGTYASPFNGDSVNVVFVSAGKNTEQAVDLVNFMFKITDDAEVGIYEFADLIDGITRSMGKRFYDEDGSAKEVPIPVSTDFQKLKVGKAGVDTYAHVRFDSAGGVLTNGETEKQVVPGANYGALPTPSRDGYDFVGWFTTEGEGMEITEQSVVALKEGETQTLYAHWKVEEGKSAPVVRTVAATDVSKDSATLSGRVESDGGLNVTDRKIVYWSKNDTANRNTITFGDDGNDTFAKTVSGLAPGTTYYYYASASNALGDGSGETLSFDTDEEEAPQEPVSITLSSSYVSMEPNGSYQLMATVLPALKNGENWEVFWTSNDTSVAAVSTDGMVMGVSAGKTIVKATTVKGRLSAECEVEVAAPPQAEYDFSEWHMAAHDSSLNGDSGFDYGPSDGGNYFMATAYLARWNGAVSEENDPYPFGGMPFRDVDADYHVQEVLWLPERANGNALDNNELKAALMQYGAMYTSFIVYWPYFDSGRTNYYYPENGNGSNGGHAVAIVGWDDNYSKNNFVNTPPGNGAFICKNSWGAGGSMDGGYFYISYYDKYLGRRGGSAVFPSLESNTNYNTIYQYDPLGAVGTITNGGFSYAANVFPAPGNNLKQDETLRAVSFYTAEKNISYEVYVVPGYTGVNSLKAKGSALASGVIENMGYHTVTLNSAVKLKAGTRFAVIVKLGGSSGTAPIYVEYPVEGYSSRARANGGEGYYSRDSANWSDLTGAVSNANFCIKAFTNRASAAGLFDAVDNDNRAYESDKVYTVEEAIAAGIAVNPDFAAHMNGAVLMDSGEDAGNLGDAWAPVVLGDNSVSFVEGAVLPTKYDLRKQQSVTPVRDQGNYGTCWTFASYASLESCLLKASKKVSSVQMGESLISYNTMVSQLGSSAESLGFRVDSLPLREGCTYDFTDYIEPVSAKNGTLLWASSDPGVASVDASGRVTAAAVGDAVITVRAKDGPSAVCSVTVQNAAIPVQEIAFDTETIALNVGESAYASYTVAPGTADGRTISWSSSDLEVAAVDPATGRITANAEGTARITGRTANGHAAELTVRVFEASDSPVTLSGLTLERSGSGAGWSGTLKVTAANNSAETIGAVIFAAAYDTNGRMIGGVSSEVTLPANRSSERTLALDLRSGTGFGKIKVMCYTRSGKPEPLAEALSENM